MGLNEFAGYLGVALAGVITGYLASVFPPRAGLMLFGSTVIVLALLMTVLWVKETLPYAKNANLNAADPSERPSALGPQPSSWEIFTFMSWRDRRMVLICQAGLVEKFVDALI